MAKQQASKEAASVSSSATASAPVVFCGPSGVGKGTLIDLLMKRFPNDQFGFSVSHTTRGPRDGEVDGVHYNFTTVEAIQKEIKDNKFVEYAEVHGRYYGTSVAAVESVQSQGKICVLDIDVQGVQNVKKSHLKPHYIFVSPPSMEVLEKRLRGRGTEKEEDVQRRLAGAAKEMEYGSVEGNFDLVLVNDDLQKTFEKLVKQMKLWYPHLKQLILSKPVVICGPTGINKGQLMEKLSERFPNQFAPAIQHTTKAESNGHQEGVDSLFVDAETMKKEVAEGKMLEYKEDKDGLVTGTSFSTVKGIVTSGKVCVLDTDVEGVKQIKKNIAKLPKDVTIAGKLDPNFMFVAPVSVEMLRSQLRASGKTEEEIKPMMESASTDLEYGQVAGHFDRIFILADVSATFEDMVYALKEWYPHLDEMAPDDPAKSCTCSVS